MRALLGPTNTGKTHTALEELCAHDDGVIGFPLRLLAREAYDKLCLRVGKQHVALVTGEEKLVPAGARYFACTVEAMPRERPPRRPGDKAQPFSFVAIDEVQLCADRERGHIFTDRLLHLRGSKTTMLLGQDTIAPILRRLLPSLGESVEIESRPRLSSLRFSGEKKLARLPKRSAVVCFSVADVYALAEEVRHHHGGAAVVTGSLSPATRNAQVRMFQDGDVDVLVATDAIGMGLNLDIEHVAFAAARKFDGDDVRNLTEAELAQIAGRAGRHLKNGTFGTTRGLPPFAADVVDRLENHRFPPLTTLHWRNSDLDFSSLAALHLSLRQGPSSSSSSSDVFSFGRPASDLLALERLMHDPRVARWFGRSGSLLTEAGSQQSQRSDPAQRSIGGDVEAFFACCQIPDFEKLGPEDHAETILEVWERSGARGDDVDDAWLSRKIDFIRDISGDVETLVARLAKVRTLAYVAHKGGWTSDDAHWQAQTRAVEESLSDALHEALRLRFVDRLARVVVTRDVRASVDEDGAVLVAGETIGRLDGLRFTAENADARRHLQTAAAVRGLEVTLQERVDALLASDPAAGFDVDAATLRIRFAGAEVGRLVKGRTRLWPRAVALAGAFDAPVRAQLDEKLTEVVHAWVTRSLPLVVALDVAARSESLPPLARGWAWAVVEGLGVCPRQSVEADTGSPDEVARRALRRHRVRLGFVDAYVDDAFKDKAIRCRAALVALWRDQPEPPSLPPAGSSSFLVAERPTGFVIACGFRVFHSAEGPRAHRCDLVDDVGAVLQSFAPPFSSPAVACEKLGCSHEALVPVLELLGFKRSAEGLFARARRR
ncbi:MAG: helicase-related protein [Deltaproteobacteria bacterium]|nr:helicase-related protein [Deltaproteobacteria bacterium]